MGHAALPHPQPAKTAPLVGLPRKTGLPVASQASWPALAAPSLRTLPRSRLPVRWPTSRSLLPGTDARGGRRLAGIGHVARQLGRVPIPPPSRLPAHIPPTARLCGAARELHPPSAPAFASSHQAPLPTPPPLPGLWQHCWQLPRHVARRSGRQARSSQARGRWQAPQPSRRARSSGTHALQAGTCSLAARSHCTAAAAPAEASARQNAAGKGQQAPIPVRHSIRHVLPARPAHGGPDIGAAPHT